MPQGIFQDDPVSVSGIDKGRLYLFSNGKGWHGSSRLRYGSF